MKVFFKLFCILIFFRSNVFSQRFDERVVLSLNQNRNEKFDGFSRSFSNSADYIGIAMPIALWTTGHFSNQQALKRHGLEAGLALAGTYAVGYLMKQSIKRDRPFVKNAEIQPVQAKDSYSMPSGSTAVAFSTATSLTYTFPKWYVAIPAFTYAAGVGYSRIRSGEHYPSDVLVGAVLGVGSAWVSQKLMHYINK